MNVVLDTHTLSWLLTNNPKLSSKGREYFRKAEIVFVPTIVLLELMYMLKRNKEINKFPTILKELKEEGRFFFTSLGLEISEKCLKNAGKLEMHDNIIVSTAEYLKLPLLTKDPQIQKVYKKIIW